MKCKRPIKEYFFTSAKACAVIFSFYLIAMAKVVGIELVVLFSFITSASYIALRVHVWNKIDYWTFDGISLKRGKKPNFSIELSEIESIRFGLPKLSGWLEFILKLDSEINYRRRLNRAEETILIYLSNNQVLPLGVSGFVNAEMFLIYVSSSFLKTMYPNNEEIAKFCEISKVAKNEIEYEQLINNQNLNSEYFEKIIRDFIDKKIIKLEEESFSSNELNKLVYSNINKVVQL